MSLVIQPQSADELRGVFTRLRQRAPELARLTETGATVAADGQILDL